MHTFSKKITALVLIVLFSISFNYAQQTKTNLNIQDQQNQKRMDDEDKFNRNADDWSLALGERLNLNASQRDSVRYVMLDYQRQRMALGQDVEDAQIEEFNTIFNKRIEGFLDDDQVNLFNTYSRSWWNEINTGIGDAEHNTPNSKRNKEDLEPNNNNQNDNRNDEIKRNSNRDKINPQRT